MEYMGLIVGIVIGAFLSVAIAMEIKNRNKKSDLFTNIVISVMGIGCSIYMIFDTFNSSKIDGQFNASLFFTNYMTWLYLVVILLSCAFVVLFLTFYLKNKDLPDPAPEEVEEETEEVLTDEEIEEILEQENSEETQEILEQENSEETQEKQEEIEVNILEETIKEHKEKESTKIDANQEVKIKEGSSQVPTNQRNPFEKK